MWATDKNFKMEQQLELETKDYRETKQPLVVTKITDLGSIKRRVMALCLSTWFFGYVLCETSLFPNAVWYHSFGPDMIQTSYIGPCLALVPLGAGLGVLIGSFLNKLMSRK